MSLLPSKWSDHSRLVNKLRPVTYGAVAQYCAALNVTKIVFESRYFWIPPIQNRPKLDKMSNFCAKCSKSQIVSPRITKFWTYSWNFVLYKMAILNIWKMAAMVTSQVMFNFWNSSLRHFPSPELIFKLIKWFLVLELGNNLVLTVFPLIVLKPPLKIDQTISLLN